MIDRVTQQGLQQTTLRNLQLNLGRMSELQRQLSSGKAISKASDDPAGMVDAMRIRSGQRATAQHGRNAADGVGWLSTVDSALSSSVTLLRQARDLTVQGASDGALSGASREALASALEATAEALREQANTTYLGRTVFAGTSDAGLAFEADGTFTGQPGARVERRVSDATLVRVDADGAAVFGAGTSSVFALLQGIAADLRAGTPVSGRLAEIDARLEVMLTEVAAAGTRYNQVLGAQEAIAARSVTLEGQLTAVEDVDLAETIVAMQSQEVAYAAALNATARALQPSLLDFLR